MRGILGKDFEFKALKRRRLQLSYTNLHKPYTERELASYPGLPLTLKKKKHYRKRFL